MAIGQARQLVVIGKLIESGLIVNQLLLGLLLQRDIACRVRPNQPAAHPQQTQARLDVDLVAFGRALLTDPELPNKARDGRLDEIVTERWKPSRS